MNSEGVPTKRKLVELGSEDVTKKVRVREKT